ncbi:MAG: hypothetical protein KJI71_04640 [Patescibacteria group bacterium]|nr:hypothetical protein [Patescibacteria group bacterium]
MKVNGFKERVKKVDKHEKQITELRLENLELKNDVKELKANSQIFIEEKQNFIGYMAKLEEMEEKFKNLTERLEKAS